MSTNLLPLGAVCEINPKLPMEGRPNDDDAVSFVPMAAVDEVTACISLRDQRQYSTVKKGYTPFRDNDVLFAKITPCMENGKVALATNLTNGIGFGSTEFHVLRASEHVLPEWLRYFVLRPSYRSKAKLRMSGAVGQQRVPADFLAQSQIPVPKLDEQRRLVDVLSRAENIVRLRKAAEEKAKEIIPALFHEMFGDPSNPVHGVRDEASTEAANPNDVLPGREGRRGEPYAANAGTGMCQPVLSGAGQRSVTAGKNVRLGDVADVASGVAKGRKVNGKVTREVPYLRVANVQAGGLDLSEMKLIPATDEEIKELAVKAGDVLLTEGGDFDKVGRGALLESDIGECIHQNHVFRVRVNPALLTPEYLASHLQTFEARQYFLKAAKKTSNLASINMTQLRNLPVPLPSLPGQAGFSVSYRTIRSIERQQSEATAHAEQTFQSLLAGVFGEGRQ